MLTLTAMHVLNDTVDPFFTSLKAGTYDKVRPQGLPCDAVFPHGCPAPSLSRGGRIAMAVVIAVTGLLILGLLAWYFRVLSQSGLLTKSD